MISCSSAAVMKEHKLPWASACEMEGCNSGSAHKAHRRSSGTVEVIGLGGRLKNN